MANWVMPLFAAVMGVALFMQMLMFAAMFVAMRRLSQRVTRIANELQGRVLPLVSRLEVWVEEAQPRVSGALYEASEMTHIARHQVERADQIITEAADRLRMRLVRSDHVVTAEEVLAARMVAEPLTTMMCCPPDDGAACIILAREDLVRSRQPGRPLVRALASALTSESYSPGHTFVGPVVGPSTMTKATASECYEAAGIGPEDVSVAYCHDAFVNEELEYYELLGFCAEGEAEKLVVEGETGPGGRIPFNTDGGLLARGHPGGPTGTAMLHEAVLQLRGEATGRQADDAKVALAHLVGGGSIATVNLLGVEGVGT